MTVVLPDYCSSHHCYINNIIINMNTIDRYMYIDCYCLIYSYTEDIINDIECYYYCNNIIINA